MNSNSKLWRIGSLVLVLCVGALHGSAFADDFDSNVERRWQETYSFEESDLNGSRLVVDNIIGEIEVVGTDESTIEIVIDGHWRGGSEQDLQQAEADLEMIVEETSYGVLVFLETPYRDNSHRYQNRSRGYRFQYDIQLQVPKDFFLDLHTVTGGGLKLTDINNQFQLETVTGDIVIEDSLTTGSIETVSGDIRLFFDSVPDLNVELLSQYGDLSTEFDYEELPHSSAVIVEQVGQLTSYRRDPSSLIKFGDGGPELTVKSLSGDIVIRRPTDS
ncbi:MAG: DUF4097 domain-containing protein [Pseudomonadales bacterium]|nr:DUF4097 domain-containing protein [Pseudomonadales bacterium]